MSKLEELCFECMRPQEEVVKLPGSDVVREYKIHKFKLTGCDKIYQICTYCCLFNFKQKNHAAQRQRLLMMLDEIDAGKHDTRVGWLSKKELEEVNIKGRIKKKTATLKRIADLDALPDFPLIVCDSELGIKYKSVIIVQECGHKLLFKNFDPNDKTSYDTCYKNYAYLGIDDLRRKYRNSGIAEGIDYCWISSLSIDSISHKPMQISTSYTLVSAGEQAEARAQYNFLVDTHQICFDRKSESELFDIKQLLADTEPVSYTPRDLTTLAVKHNAAMESVKEKLTKYVDRVTAYIGRLQVW